MIFTSLWITLNHFGPSGASEMSLQPRFILVRALKTPRALNISNICQISCGTCLFFDRFHTVYPLGRPGEVLGGLNWMKLMLQTHFWCSWWSEMLGDDDVGGRRWCWWRKMMLLEKDDAGGWRWWRRMMRAEEDDVGGEKMMPPKFPKTNWN